MGAWGSGPFDNDAAVDWLSLATGDGAETAVRTTLGRIAGHEGYLDADLGQEAVAAAATAARQLPAGPSLTMVPTPPEGGEEPFTVDDALRDLAVRALAQVAAPTSELADLWSGDAVWTATLDQLRDAFAS